MFMDVTLYPVVLILNAKDAPGSPKELVCLIPSARFPESPWSVDDEDEVRPVLEATLRKPPVDVPQDTFVAVLKDAAEPNEDDVASV